MRGKHEKHPYNLKAAVKNFERGYLINILQLSNGDKRKAAQMLDVPIGFLRKKIEEYEIICSLIIYKRQLLSVTTEI